MQLNLTLSAYVSWLIFANRGVSLSSNFTAAVAVSTKDRAAAEVERLANSSHGFVELERLWLAELRLA